MSRSPATPGRLGAVLAVAGVVVLVDQLSKSAAQARLTGRVVHVLGPLDLRLDLNTGAAFSLGRGLPPVLVVGVVLVVLAVLFFTTSLDGAPSVTGAGLVLGGAVSNLGDRLFRANGGAVIDWIHLPHWPTFNLADSAVVAGVGLLLVGQLRSPRRAS